MHSTRSLLALWPRLLAMAALVGVFASGWSALAPTQARASEPGGVSELRIAPPTDMDCVVEPSIVVDVGSAVPGLLAEAFHDRSDFVQQGALMARLESAVEEVSLAIAGAAAEDGSTLALRQLTASFGARTLDRNQVLSKSASISPQTLDQVRTEAEIAQLQVKQEEESRLLAVLELERAKALVARREIRSPIDGVVMQRFRSAGEYVDSEPVYRVAQLDPLNVEVIVPIDYLSTLEPGMRAHVTLAVPGFQNQALEAKVERIDAVADAASATYGVRLVLDNPDLAIPSGVRCRVDFEAR